MNFRVSFDPAAPGATRIEKTGAAADRQDIWPTLAGARVELAYRAADAVKAIKPGSKAALKIAERDLRDGDAEAGEVRGVEKQDAA